jgi:hypothetical protein
MMKKSSLVKQCLVVVLVLTALCLGAAPVKADPITYYFSGIASGDLNGITVFDTSSALISIVGDTTNVTEPFGIGAGFWRNDGLTGSIHIQGSQILGYNADNTPILAPFVMDGTFTDPLYVYCDNLFLQVGFGHNFNDPTNGPSQTDLVAMAPDPPDGLDNYNLKSAFGPVAPAGGWSSQFTADITILGVSGNLLTIEDMYDASFVAVVPLPGGVVLLGAGLLRLIGYRRSRNG